MEGDGPRRTSSSTIKLDILRMASVERAPDQVAAGTTDGTAATGGCGLTAEELAIIHGEVTAERKKLLYSDSLRRCASVATVVRGRGGGLADGCIPPARDARLHGLGRGSSAGRAGCCDATRRQRGDEDAALRGRVSASVRMRACLTPTAWHKAHGGRPALWCCHTQFLAVHATHRRRSLEGAGAM